MPYKDKEKALAQSRYWRLTYPERSAASKKKYREANPKMVMLTGAKRRAKKFNLDFNINTGDIIIPKVCPVLGIPLFIGNGKICDNSPTLDRIDNTKGYVKGNVMVISFKANSLKKNGTAQEHLAIANYMLQHQQQQFGE